MEKFICIHGHFYQPPRENPWLETVELQDSAAPSHDWNERITLECYAPNATARILNGEGRITDILSNYSKISFNFGPTLLAWMQDQMPDVHQAIVESDKLSQKRFSGHGSAIAQVYNHMIMPLANTADKYTQTVWGIRDFEHRFGRKPEGMWLAETAADTPTLETLAELGIKFTILSPFQAHRTRELGKRHWRDVGGGKVDPTRAYLVKLPSGRSINVFFYDAPVSQAVAFEKLLSSGERLAHRLTGAFSDSRQRNQLVHIATDGESYGHHHRRGEMALAYALRYIETNNLARLTNYGEFLEKNPPTHEVQIHEKTAWSCVHGVGRWAVDCGCNSGGHGHWNQSWRAPLRAALDWLRDRVGPLFESKGRGCLKEPWAARNDYIQVILDRSPEVRERFFARHAAHDLTQDEKVEVLLLMEMQRHAMLMYTSCGWFFDELSGIETVQVIQYAARVIQLANDLFDQDLEPGFLDLLEKAKSNIPENCDGRCIYTRFVKPAMIDRPKAVAHYAISSLFQRYGDRTRIFSFEFEDEVKHMLESGKTRLALGRTRIISRITQRSAVMNYAVLYMGEHNLAGGVAPFTTPEAFDQMACDIKAAYEAADFPETIRRMDRHCPHSSFSLKSLFKDEQRRILNEIMSSTRQDLENRFRQITEIYTPLMKFLESAGAPLPSALQAASDFVLHRDIRQALQDEQINFDRLETLIREAQSRGDRVLDSDLSYLARYRMEALMLRLAAEPMALDAIRTLRKLAEVTMPLPLGLNLWKVQNTYGRMLQTAFPKFRDRAAAGDAEAASWMEEFASLGDRLQFAVKNLLPSPQMLQAA
jgi:alpha-amylase/alpha-mannosidase (GH57 family)